MKTHIKYHNILLKDTLVTFFNNVIRATKSCQDVCNKIKIKINHLLKLSQDCFKYVFFRIFEETFYLQKI